MGCWLSVAFRVFDAFLALRLLVWWEVEEVAAVAQKHVPLDGQAM